jgi:hypothetical protein
MFVAEQNSYNATDRFAKAFAVSSVGHVRHPSGERRNPMQNRGSLEELRQEPRLLRHQTSSHCAVTPTPEHLSTVEQAKQRLQAAVFELRNARKKLKKSSQRRLPCWKNMTCSKGVQRANWAKEHWDTQRKKHRIMMR